MKAKLVRIGNSRGVRLPKPVIEEAQLTDEVEVSVRDGAVLIRSAAHARAGWAEAAQAMQAAGTDRLLDPEVATRFDEAEWQW